MGLRETKAARTRQQIVDAALDLFIEHGFDQTTMEEIAERAEIGSSTLYRYFPSKDLVILEPLLVFTEMGDHVRSRPSSEALEVTLGMAIASALTGFTSTERVAEVRRIVDNSPSPRAKLWDVMATSRNDLERAIADRLDLAADHLTVMLTARMTMVVYELAAEAWWAGDHSRPIGAVVQEVLQRLQASASVVLPAPVDSTD